MNGFAVFGGCYGPPQNFEQMFYVTPKAQVASKYLPPNLVQHLGYLDELPDGYSFLFGNQADTDPLVKAALDRIETGLRSGNWRMEY